MGKKMLELFVTSRIRRKILVVYAKYPDFKTHGRALSRLIKEDPANVQRELSKLEAGGFLIANEKDGVKIYQCNKQFPILKELQSIVIKSQQEAEKQKILKKKIS